MSAGCKEMACGREVCGLGGCLYNTGFSNMLVSLYRNSSKRVLRAAGNSSELNLVQDWWIAPSTFSLLSWEVSSKADKVSTGLSWAPLLLAPLWLGPPSHRLLASHTMPLWVVTKRPGLLPIYLWTLFPFLWGNFSPRILTYICLPLEQGKHLHVCLVEDTP